MSTSHDPRQTQQAQSAQPFGRPSALPAFKPIGISSVKAAVEQMRDKSAPKPAGTLPPVLQDGPWAA